jgi:hypothetical protein
MIVNYETLIANATDTLARIARFLRLPPSPQCTHTHTRVQTRSIPWPWCAKVLCIKM